MGNIVAIAALTELGKHASRMRSAVAVLAGRDILVLVLMAGHAGDSLMLGSAAHQQVIGFFVAGSTHLVRSVGCIGNSCRHMSLVAALAVRCSHVSAMRLMALRTGRNLAVDVVTEAAGQLGMLAGHLLELGDLLGMAGETLVGHIVSQLDDLGGVRVVVAAQTVLKLVVRFVTMAHAAGRDNVLAH